MSDQPNTLRTPPDWERIESDYRAGLLSLREIAARNGITEGAIRKRAKRDEWTRDLAAKVRAKAEDLVRRQAVRETVRAEGKATERVLIEANAQVIATVRSSHRVDIGRARALCMALLAELEGATADVPALASLGEMMRTADENGTDKLNDIYRAVISLPERTKTMKALAESLKHLVAIEREAYGIAEGVGDADKPTPQRVPVEIVDASAPDA